MKSASMNSALETFFEIFVMKSALENFSNFSKKINVQTTDRSVQNFWGLAFGMFDDRIYVRLTLFEFLPKKKKTQKVSEKNKFFFFFF